MPHDALFEKAKGNLWEILRLVDEFNGISAKLDRLGYGPIKTPDGPWPMPILSVEMNGCGFMVVEDANILDEFQELTPKPKFRIVKQPKKRAG